MTLSRQLLLSGLIVLLCLFTGMITFVVINTQSFLNQQLASHSQDTATALGLTLTTIMKNDDAATANRVVDAVWDRGYYQTIIVESKDGKVIVERNQKVKFYGVPSWFINLLHLDSPEKESLIMDGWSKVGKVKIISNPGFAYQQVWLTFIDSLQWLVITTLIAAVLGSMLLFIILRPLRAITAQAIAICNKQFAIQETLPWTIDLRLVVEAMNNMSKRLQHLFEDQIQTSEQLREQAFKDPVTKLGNRRYFDLQFDYLLQEKEKYSNAALMIVELKNFKEYNDKHGYQEGDYLLQHTADIITRSCQGIDNAIIAQAKGASIFIVLPEKSKEMINEIAQSICQQFNEFQSKGLSKEPDVGSIGIVFFTLSDSKKDIMSQVDMALRKAQSQGPNQWAFVEGLKVQEIHSAHEWGNIFAKVIRENTVMLFAQQIAFIQTQNYNLYEMLMRIKLDDNNIISAGVFMPMAEMLNQVQSLDKLVLENVIQKILGSDDNTEYSVNLSPRSLGNDDFKKWFFLAVKPLAKKTKQLVVELPEYYVVNQADTVREFFLMFTALGGKTSIDHYGKNFSSFTYLYNLKLNYLKIDGSFIKNIHENEKHQAFIRSLVDIAHSLEIIVIAEAVETEDEHKTLLQLKVDGVQGYFVGKPTELSI
ncbi:MAG: EAL domain-containing protein [Proteobacteria bacterium]|nr:EAL domain-containing protein [Pseudomonadota bacterium]